MAREGLLNAWWEFVFHVGGDSDEEGQACGDDIYADIAGVAPLE
jgi:hypothetical protein